jgi:glutamate-ammonia-ligase adenylyltransferase
LAEQLSRRPKVLDAVLDPGFFGPLPTTEELRRNIASVIPEETPLDEVVDRARVLGKEQSFRIGVRVLSETVSAVDAGVAFSDLAELLLDRLHRAVISDSARRHGLVAGGRSAVLALGKLGGREMTAASDLDLILVYDADDAANQYFARLTQRLIAAITAPTAEGVLYEADMRLRPSGSKGPVATSLDSFRAYHRESAWTWEKLALTRARPVCGDESLQAELQAAIHAALCTKRDAGQTRADVLDMRKLMLKEQGTAGLWDIKRVRGGLVEVEFVVQTLQLLHASAHPEVLDTNTLAALENLGRAGCIRRGDGEALRAASMLYHRLTQVLRLCVGHTYNPAHSPAGLNRIVASATGSPDIATAESLLQDTQARVAALFDEIIGPCD